MFLKYAFYFLGIYFTVYKKNREKVAYLFSER